MSDDKQAITDKTGAGGLQDSLDITPLFANMTNVTAAGDVTRITFGETYAGAGTKYHSSIVLPTQAALELSRLIQKVVGVHQKQMERDLHNMDPKGSVN